MRKIASVTPIWNQAMWIKPHFEMLSKLDHNLVIMHHEPLPSYRKEHGYSRKPDLSEQILQKYFPKVKIVESNFSPADDFGAELYNEGLRQLEDYDIVFRLDPDMFFSKENWEKMIDYIGNTNFDAYRMDFANDSINYYMTESFDHGLKDAKENDILALNPKKLFKVIEDDNTIQVLGWPYDNDTFFKWDNFMCHHMRGWNKPKSTPNPRWLEYDSTFWALKNYGNNGDWYRCPQEIKEPLELWLKQLKNLSLQQGQKLLYQEQ